MLILNKHQEPKFKLLVNNEWQDWEVVDNLMYSNRGNYWMVRKEGGTKEHKLLQDKGNELLNENKLKV